MFLILVYGLWISPVNIESLRPVSFGESCDVITVHGKHKTIKDRTCDQVANEINRQTEVNECK